MGLINYKTDLTSVKFGKDRPGGGSSNQPYVVSSIPEERSGGSAIENILEKGTLKISRSAKDVSRLTQYFTDFKSFSGAGFVLNQNLLARQSSDIRGGSKDYKSGSFFPGGLYTPANTIMQAGEVAFGAHYKKQGLDVNGGILGGVLGILDGALGLNIGGSTIQQPEYLKVYKDKSNSRLKNLYLTKGYELPEVDYTKLKTTTSLSEFNTKINDFIAPTGFGTKNILDMFNIGLFGNNLLNDDVLYEYNGGPSLGVTRIRKYQDSRNPTRETGQQVYQKYKQSISKNYLPLNLLSSRFLKDTEFVTYDKPGDLTTPLRKDRIKKSLEKRSGVIAGDVDDNFSKDFKDIKDIAGNETNKVQGFPKVVDFRNIIDPRFPSWNGVNMYDSNSNERPRISLNDPAHRKKLILNRDTNEGFDEVNDFSKTQYIVDKINHSGVFNEIPNMDDLAKFRIGVLKRGGGREYIQFRAHIDSFDDSYSADWNEQKYMGRGEKFFKYNGFDRDIGLNFTVAALSKPELIPMYKKLNYLASLMAPNYGENGYMSGNIITLTLGGYVYEMPGILQGMTIAPHEESPWEIGLGYKGNTTSGDGWDSDVKELPLVIKVTGFKFKPIHDFVPKFQDNFESGRTRFISLSTGKGNNYDN